jgi:hypothetical protein
MTYNSTAAAARAFCRSVKKKPLGMPSTPSTCATSSSTTTKSPILSVLTSPTKLAQLLDREVFRLNNKSVTSSPRLLCLDIQRYQINAAVVGHPYQQQYSHSQLEEQSWQKNKKKWSQNNKYNSNVNSYGNTATASALLLPPITTKERKIQSSTVDTLWDIIQQYKICGMIVDWPLEDDDHRVGAKCGRVLYTLEKLLLESMISSTDRPVCLFPTTDTTTTTTMTNNDRIDKWGRCARYGRTKPVIEDLRFCVDDIICGIDDGITAAPTQGSEPIYYYHALRDRYFDAIRSRRIVNEEMNGEDYYYEADSVSEVRPLEIWNKFVHNHGHRQRQHRCLRVCRRSHRITTQVVTTTSTMMLHSMATDRRRRQVGHVGLSYKRTEDTLTTTIPF